VFGYVPGYGKFGLFNKYIVHWDVTVNAGIGVIWTEIIPVRIDDQIFSNTDICPSLAISTRMFVTDWLALSIGLRDYMFIDKFENKNRPEGQNAADAKANGVSEFTQNVMVFVSAGLYLPTSFSYKTPR
jgi:hypothetical protein